MLFYEAQYSDITIFYSFVDIRNFLISEGGFGLNMKLQLGNNYLD